MRYNIIPLLIIIGLLLFFPQSIQSNPSELSLNVSFLIEHHNDTITLENDTILSYNLTNITVMLNDTPYNVTDTLYCSYWNVTSNNNSDSVCKGSNDCCTFLESGDFIPQSKYNSGSPMSKTIDTSLYDDNISIMMRLGYYDGTQAGLSDYNYSLIVLPEKNKTYPPNITINSPKNGSTVTEAGYSFTASHHTIMECAIIINGEEQDIVQTDPDSNITGIIPDDILLNENVLTISCEDDKEQSSTEHVVFYMHSPKITIESDNPVLGSPIRFELGSSKESADITIEYPIVPGFPNKVSFSIGYNTTNDNKIYYFEDTYRAGKYTITGKLRYNNTLIEEFSNEIIIQNNLECSIISSSSYLRGHSLPVTVKTGKGKEPYTTILNGQTKTGQSNEYTITVSGDDTMMLSAVCSDFYKNTVNATRQISIMENITFFFKDSDDNKELNATVSVYGNSVAGSRASFLLPKGTYSYTVSSAGYKPVTNNISVTSSQNITVSLSKDEFSSLSITPPDNDTSKILTVGNEYYLFSFALSNPLMMECGLQLSSDDTWYTTVKTISTNNSKLVSYNISNDIISNYGLSFYAQVTCNKDNSIKKSESFNITVSESQEDSDEVEFQALARVESQPQDIILAEIVEVRIHNYGNIPMDLRLYGYGALEDDGKLLDCPTDFIPESYQRFSINSMDSFDQMINLSANSAMPNIVSLNLPAGEDSSVSSYWRLQVPMLFEEAQCQGSVVFVATQAS
ncbi:MAG: hypothetical protein ACMXYL_03235 [Candidatus Woesearchaeota archaeon]